MNANRRLHRIVAAQPYPLLFATISGAHLYGFPSPDSDFELRGAHVLPVERVIGLDVLDETVEDSRVIEGLEMDIVSHDVRKVFGLLLKKNGYVLEQLYSPLVVHATPEHDDLKRIARNCVNRRLITPELTHFFNPGEVVPDAAVPHPEREPRGKLIEPELHGLERLAKGFERLCAVRLK